MDRRRQAAVIRRHHARQPCRLGQHPLQHQRVHIDQAVLQQVQRQHGQFLVLETVAGYLAAFAEEDEAMGPVPVLDHVKPDMDFTPQVFEADVAAQEDGLDDLAELAECGIGRVLDCRASEAAQDRLRIRRAVP